MAATTTRKPASSKSELRRSRPLDGTSRFGRPFERLVEEFLGRRRVLEEDGRIVPALDVCEDERCVTVSAEPPGRETEDVRIRFEDGVLTIRMPSRDAAEPKVVEIE